MIEATGLSRSFGAFKAVDDIAFTIQKGEIVGLLGPNGAGKTTTMRMITGFLEPSSGRVVVDGIDAAASPRAVKEKIGYMPESAPLYGDMIVDDYLRYVARMRGVDPDERVPALAKTCGIREVMHKNVAELSRGYRQRVGLAHALMDDPEILVLDEPTSGLDPNQIVEVRKLIKELGRTRTVIVSTHILGEVEAICDRVIIISRGKIAADAPTADLRRRYGHGAALRVQASGCASEELAKACAALDGAADCAAAAAEEGLAAVEIGTEGGKDLRPAVFNLAKERGWTLYEMSLRHNSLEDVFRVLTNGGAE